jgi:hypothetical protein
LVSDYTDQLNEIVHEFRKIITKDNIVEIKKISNALDSNLLRKGNLAHVSLDALKNQTSLVSEKLKQLLELEIIQAESSLIVILNKESDMGMHFDTNRSNINPRLLANMIIPQDRQCCFQIKDKTINLENINFIVFNPSESLHTAWNLSSEEWIFLVLNLKNYSLAKEYEIYG